MDDSETLELVCARAWPAVVDEPLGDWRLRWAGGFTGRANSALAVGDPGRSVTEALTVVCDFAHGLEIPPIVQVVEGSECERAVAAAGWSGWTRHAAGHQVSVLTGPLPPGPAGRGPADAAVLDEPTSTWWELAAGNADPSTAERHVLTSGRIGYGVAGTAGAVRGAVVDDWLHVSRLAVRPGFRRRGLASALLSALAAWGREHGALRWVLQVAAGNAAAFALYSGLGCTEHHRYRYWGPAPGPCEDPQS